MNLVVSGPGFIVGETVAAVVLQSLAESLAGPNGDVVVPSPPHAWTGVTDIISSGATEGVAPNDRIGTSSSLSCWTDPSKNVVSIIRALNAHLVALMRPESVLLAPLALPLAYREEYILRQVRGQAVA
jgi:hypothetical protein